MNQYKMRIHVQYLHHILRAENPFTVGKDDK
jgi:hypothetical protein